MTITFPYCEYLLQLTKTYTSTIYSKTLFIMSKPIIFLITKL